MANCAVMAAKDPLATEDPMWVQNIEWFFTITFSIEGVCKILAMGVYPESPTTYFRSGWHWLDVLTVGVSWLSLLAPDAGNLGAIRSVRVLRPLRTVTRIKSMRVLVGALLASLPDVGDVVLLFGFFLMAFGVCGVELFRGRLHYRCYDEAEWLLDGDDAEAGDFCTHGTYLAIANGTGGSDGKCPAGSVCRYTETNPNSGAAGFDTIFFAVANIFQCITLEGWTDLMYMLQPSRDYVSQLYFLLVVFFGAFFVINLFLVVISDNYMLAREQSEKEMELMEEQKHAALAEQSERSGKPKPGDAGPSFGEKMLKRAGEGLSSCAAATKRSMPGIPSIRAMTEGDRFEKLMIALIIGNTVVMGMEFYGDKSSGGYNDGLSAINYLFTAIFLVELVVKMLGYGPIDYFADNFNCFDFLVVVFSIVETAIAVGSDGDGAVNLSVLRTFRIMRAFKLARSFKGLRDILNTILRSLGQARDLSLLLILCMFIFSLLGMELFAGSFGDCSGDPDNGTDHPNARAACLAACDPATDVQSCEGGNSWERPEENFDELGPAMMSMFVVFVGENWNEVYFAAFQRSGWGATIYFLAAVLVGNFMVINLFVAILCANFDADGPDKESEELEVNAVDQAEAELRADEEHAAKEGLFEVGFGDTPRATPRALLPAEGDAADKSAPDAALGRSVKFADDVKAAPGGGGAAAQPTDVEAGLAEPAAEAQQPSEGPVFNPIFSGMVNKLLVAQKATTNLAAAADQGRVRDDLGLQRRGAGSAAMDTNEEIFHSAILESNGCCPPQHPLRVAILKLVLHRDFEMLVLVLIVGSSACLALDHPLDDPDSFKAQVLYVLDILFTSLFTVELVLKCVAFGVFATGSRNPHAYLRSGWNLLDLFVVMISWASLFLSFANITSGGLRALRALRALRPLRLVNRIEGMKTVVKAMFSALPAVLNVSVVSLLFMLIFSILGVQLFGGRFGRCSVEEGPPSHNRTACEAHVVDVATNATAVWYNPDIGDFDNTVSGMILLFEIITAEMWPDMLHLMHDAADDPHMAPVKDNSVWAARMYCIAWILTGALFIGNLFVGVVIDNFDKLRADERGRGQLTKEQMDWVAVQNKVIACRAVRRPPRPNHNELRAKTYDMVMSQHFDDVVTGAIAVNVLVLAVTHWVKPGGMTDLELAVEDFIEITNTLFAFLWTVEVILKLVAFNAQSYFSFTWNRFDFLLAMCGLSELLIEVLTRATGTNDEAWAQEFMMVLRLVRVARLMRVVKNVGSLRTLLHSLVKSLPSLLSVGSLLLLLLFIFAVLGVQLFYNVAFNDFVNEYANFTNIGIALITLFRCATGESWNGIMHDLQVRPHGADWLTKLTGKAPRLSQCADDGSDCGDFVAVPYFFTFTMLSFFLLLNAVIAVLLEHFSENPDDNPIHPENFNAFTDEWSKLDPHATRAIPATSLPVLLRRASPPLGLGEDMNSRSLLVVLRALDKGAAQLNVHREGMIFYHELLMSLARRLITLPLDGLGASRFAAQHRESVRNAIRVQTKSKWRQSQLKGVTSSSDETPLSVLDIWAAQQLQCRWQGFKVRAKMKKTKTGVDLGADARAAILEDRKIAEEQEKRSSAGSSDGGAAETAQASSPGTSGTTGAPAPAAPAAEPHGAKQQTHKHAKNGHHAHAQAPAPAPAVQAASAPAPAPATAPVPPPAAAKPAAAKKAPTAPPSVASQPLGALQPPDAWVGGAAPRATGALGLSLPQCATDLKLPAFEPGPAGDVSPSNSDGQLGSIKLPRTLLVATGGSGEDDVAATGVFITDEAAEFPFKWVPCQPRLPDSRAASDSPADYVYVVYSLTSTGGKNLSEEEVVNNPDFVLRMLHRQAAATLGASLEGDRPNSAPNRHCGASDGPGDQRRVARRALAGTSGRMARQMGHRLKELQVSKMRHSLGEMHAEMRQLEAARHGGYLSSRAAGRVEELKDQVKGLTRRLENEEERLERWAATGDDVDAISRSAPWDDHEDGVGSRMQLTPVAIGVVDSVDAVEEKMPVAGVRCTPPDGASKRRQKQKRKGKLSSSGQAAAAATTPPSGTTAAPPTAPTPDDAASSAAVTADAAPIAATTPPQQLQPAFDAAATPATPLTPEQTPEQPVSSPDATPGGGGGGDGGEPKPPRQKTKKKKKRNVANADGGCGPAAATEPMAAVASDEAAAAMGASPYANGRDSALEC